MLCDAESKERVVRIGCTVLQVDINRSQLVNISGWRGFLGLGYPWKLNPFQEVNDLGGVGI